MSKPGKQGVVAVVLVTMFALAIMGADALNRTANAQSGIAPSKIGARKAASPLGAPVASTPKAPMDPAARAADDARRVQIKALDDQIKALREQLHSQSVPLEAQLKDLRGKFDAQIDSLQAQRKALVEQGESPELRALNDEEATQLADLAAREKADVEKLRQQYGEQRKAIQLSFQQRRQGLRSGNK